MLSTDTTVFLLVPRSAQLRIPNDHLTYLAKQLFGKAQRANTRKYCPNVSHSTGSTCGIVLDSRDIHLRTCRMNNINHVKHAVVQAWFQNLAKQPQQLLPSQQCRQETQRSNLLAICSLSMCHFKTKAKMEDAASSTLALSPQQRNRTVSKLQSLHCTPQNSKKLRKSLSTQASTRNRAISALSPL